MEAMLLDAIQQLHTIQDGLNALLQGIRNLRCPYMSAACIDWLNEAISGILAAIQTIQGWIDELNQVLIRVRGLDCSSWNGLQVTGLLQQIQARLEHNLPDTPQALVNDAQTTYGNWVQALRQFGINCACAVPPVVGHD